MWFLQIFAHPLKFCHASLRGRAPLQVKIPSIKSLCVNFQTILFFQIYLCDTLLFNLRVHKQQWIDFRLWSMKQFSIMRLIFMLRVNKYLIINHNFECLLLRYEQTGENSKKKIIIIKYKQNVFDLETWLVFFLFRSDDLVTYSIRSFYRMEVLRPKK